MLLYFNPLVNLATQVNCCSQPSGGVNFYYYLRIDNKGKSQ